MLAEVITALDGTPFDQSNGRAVPQFRESSVPLSVIEDAAPLEHLLFNVFVDDSPNTDEQRDAPGGFAKVESMVTVAFVYNLRPTDQLTDARLASDAGLAVTRALMGRDLSTIMIVRLVNAWRPLVSPSGTKLLGAVEFSVAHELPL